MPICFKLVLIAALLLSPASAYANEEDKPPAELTDTFVYFKKLNLYASVTNWKTKFKRKPAKGPEVATHMTAELRFWPVDAPSKGLRFIDPERPHAGHSEASSLHAYLWMTMTKSKNPKEPHGSNEVIRIRKETDKWGTVFRLDNIYADMEGSWWLRLIFTEPGYYVDHTEAATTILDEDDELASIDHLVDEANDGFYLNPEAVERIVLGDSPLNKWISADLRDNNQTDGTEQVRFNDEDSEAEYTLVVFLATGCPCSQAHVPYIDDIKQMVENQLTEKNEPHRPLSLRTIGVYSNLIANEQEAAEYFSNLDIDFPVVYDRWPPRKKQITPDDDDPKGATGQIIVDYYEHALGLGFTTPYALLFRSGSYDPVNSLVFYGSPTGQREEPHTAEEQPLADILSAIAKGSRIPQRSRFRGIGCPITNY